MRNRNCLPASASGNILPVCVYDDIYLVRTYRFVRICGCVFGRLVKHKHQDSRVALDPPDVVNRYDGISNICIRKFLPIILSHLKAIFGHFES